MAIDIEELKHVFREHLRHRSWGGPGEDVWLDRLLGLDPGLAEPNETLGELLMRYGRHRMEKGDLPYAVIRSLFRELPKLAGSEIEEPLVDLGCGYGRIGFYGALIDDGFRFWGMELVPERVAEATRVRNAWGFSGLHFEQGNVLTDPWPETTRFCVMNPVLPSLIPALLERLSMRTRRRIVIACVSTFGRALQEQPWVQEFGSPPETPDGVRWFASTHGLSPAGSRNRTSARADRARQCRVGNP